MKRKLADMCFRLSFWFARLAGKLDPMPGDIDGGWRTRFDQDRTYYIYDGSHDHHDHA